MRENNGYCFLLLIEWLTCLMVEFDNILHSRDLKMVLIFLVAKVFKKGTIRTQMSKCLTLTHEMLCHAIVSDKPGGLSVCSHPLPQENLQSSSFWRFLLLSKPRGFPTEAVSVTDFKA